MRPVTTSTLGRCVASTRWMPEARASCVMRCDRLLDVARGDHHEVGELVDDHQQVRVRSRSCAREPGSGLTLPARTAVLKSSMCRNPKFARSS